MILALLACTDDGATGPVDKRQPQSIESGPVDSGVPAETGETGGTGETAETGDSGPPSDRDLYVYTDERYEGDDSCLGAPTLSVDASCQGWQDVSGAVVDLGGGGYVGSPTIEFWTDDDITGAADSVAFGTAEGSYSAELPVCQLMATRVQGSGVVPTIFQHRALEWRSTGATTSEEYAIPPDTLALAAELVGAELTASEGSVLGFVFDCSRAPVANAQLFLHDSDDQAPAGMTVAYFLGGFPDPSVDATSSDGVVSAFNVPPGPYVAEIWGWDGGAYVMLSSSPIRVDADTLTIAYLVIGQDDGGAWPDVCFEDCSKID